jgi:hypothetical protein
MNKTRFAAIPARAAVRRSSLACMERAGRRNTCPIFDLHASSSGPCGIVDLTCPSQGAAMNELGDWIQIHWYELGSLLLQSAFLGTAVWFTRQILRTMRASQEQVGALLKLTMSDAMDDRAPSGAAAHRSTPYVMADWPAPTEAPAALSLPQTDPLRKRLEAAWHGIMCWLQTPMSSYGFAPWRRVVRWLQAPAGS